MTISTILIISNKKAPVGADLKNGANVWSLLELFNKILHPVLTSSKEVLLYFEIKNFINGLEKSKPIIYNKDTGW